jgi:MFS family permease
MGRGTILGAILRDPVLRRTQGAFLAYNTTEWAMGVAIIVYAFARGGPAEAALVSAALYLPSILVAPWASSLGDRGDRIVVLTRGYVVLVIALAATAGGLALDLGIGAYGLAAVAATVITVDRPIQSAVLPDLVRSPDELTAANAAAGTVEGAGTLLGPVIAGLLLTVGGPASVFLAATIWMALAALALLPLTRRSDREVRGAPELTDAEAEPDAEALLAGLAAGFRSTMQDAGLRAMTIVLSFAVGLTGALDVYYAVLAIDVFGLGEPGVGYLGAAAGVGGLIGSTASIVLVGRRRLTLPLIASMLAFGGAIAAIAIVSDAWAAALLLVASGIGLGFTYVIIQTMTQRLAGDDVMSRVFGVQEAVSTAAMAAGSLSVPILIGAIGIDAALALSGLLMGVGAAIVAPALVRADRVAARHPHELEALRRVPMFMPLSGPVLERLAADARLQDVPAGTTLIREGDPGDAAYVLVSGRAEISVDGVVIRQQVEPGEVIGEIALLRDVPRTATVRAVGGLEVVRLDRDAFLVALSGQGRSRRLAHRLADEHWSGGHRDAQRGEPAERDDEAFAGPRPAD